MLPELSYQSSTRWSCGSGSSRLRMVLRRRRRDSLVEEIVERAEPIRRQVEEYVDGRQIPLVHIRNLMSLPYNLPATLAFYNLAIERPDIGFFMQHHDIYWEGPNAKTFLTPYRAIERPDGSDHVSVAAQRPPRAHQPAGR